MKTEAIVCDCCKALIGVGSKRDLADMREAGRDGGGPGGAVHLHRKDMCGVCWGRGCEFGRKHLRRRAA